MWHATNNFTPFGSSEFIEHSLLHLHNLQFHNYCHRQYHNYFSCWSYCYSLDTTQLVVSGLHLILNTSNWLNTHYSLLLNSVCCSLCRLGTDNLENTSLLGNRYQVLLSGVSTYALPSNSRCTDSPVAWRHSLARKGVYQALRNDGRSGDMWRHSRERRGHVTPTSCCAIHVTIHLV
jgi:hypothetical protein